MEKPPALTLQPDMITLNFYVSVTLSILCSTFYLFKYVCFSMLKCLIFPSKYLHPLGQHLSSLHEYLNFHGDA